MSSGLRCRGATVGGCADSFFAGSLSECEKMAYLIDTGGLRGSFVWFRRFPGPALSRVCRT